VIECRVSCQEARPSAWRWRVPLRPTLTCFCSTNHSPGWTSRQPPQCENCCAPGRSALLITHDLLDVLTLADRVLVLESGKVVETGSAASVLAAPRSRFGARFAGVYLVSGTAGPDGALNTEWGSAWHGNPATDLTVGQPAVAVFPPAAVAVYRDKPHGSPRNLLEVTVAELDGSGPAIRVRTDEQPDGAPGLAADITAESAAELRLAPGERVYFSVKAQEITVHPAP
jgi:molybdate transport system ATP-binding protein